MSPVCILPASVQCMSMLTMHAVCHVHWFCFLLQKCTKDRATKSILCVRDVSEAAAKEAVDRVFSACFKDTAPFEKVPP